jgi:hypothetical protein
MKNPFIGRAGNHTWNNIQPTNGRVVKVDEITGNLTRAWVIETRAFNASESSWGSNTNGLIRVGRIPWKKNGTLNKKFHKALERFVDKAEKQDITVIVTLFEGTFQQYIDYKGGWKNHWTSDLKNSPSAPEYVHTKGEWNKFQRAHVKEVAKRLSDNKNIAAMVGNELHSNSIDWFQKKVVEWWKKWSESPIGVGYAQGVKPSRGKSQDWMAKTGADWMSPAGGQRISGFNGWYLFDTDHSWPLQSNVNGLRSAWARGDGLLLMDGFHGQILKNQQDLAPDRAFIDSIV